MKTNSAATTMDAGTGIEMDLTNRQITTDSDGASYNRIDIALGPTLVPSVNQEDQPVVKSIGSNEAPALEISVYCPITKIFVAPPEGSRFVAAEPADGTFTPESAVPSNYQTTIDPEGILLIEADNNNQVIDPSGKEWEDTGTASLSTNLRAGDGSTRSLEITLCAPPFRQVDVNFDPDGQKKFTYPQFDTSGGPLQITMPQDGGIVFTLSAPEGAEFDRNEPFYFDSEGEGAEKPDWLIDVGTDGRVAFMADLYEDLDSQSFLFQVNYGGSTYQSEDPTIVNVDPSESGT